MPGRAVPGGVGGPPQPKGVSVHGGNGPQPTGALNPNPAATPDGGHTEGPSARLPGIVSRSGVLGRMARTAGEQYANQRGLLNSSIGADASYRALLDHAVPLAQGDTTTELADRSRQSQEIMQQRDLRVQQLMQERGLSHDAAMQEANRELQKYGIDEETGRHTVDAAFREKELQQRDAWELGRQAIERFGIDSANNRHEAELELQQYGIDMDTARHAVDAAFREKELSKRSEWENERVRVEQERIAADLATNKARIAAENARHAAEVQTRHRGDVSSSVASIRESHDRQYQAILLNTNLDDAGRTAQIASLKAWMNRQISLTESLFGTDLDWDDR